MTSIVSPKPVAYECKFACYAKHHETDDDIHVVKERQHFEDGSTKPFLRILKNKRRPFYVTKKGAQNHESKKEAEYLTNLIRYDCTQTELRDSVAKALNMQYVKGPLRKLHASQYVYGSDLLSTTYIKQTYMNKWPQAVSKYSLAVFDTETDVIHGTGEIIMATVSYKEKVITAVLKSFVAGYSDVESRLRALALKYLGDDIKKRNINIEFVFCDTEIDIVNATMAKGHEWKPDFMAVWNLPFDIGKIKTACEKADVAIEDIMNDPSIPKEYRVFDFNEGAAKKVTTSGKVMNYKPAQRWHSIRSPASFYWVDAMCAYRQIRTGRPEEPSYSLDAILEKNIKRKKLKFEQAEGYSGLQLHKFMQKNYPLEYIIYNIFDCIGIELLDEQTLDLSMSMPMLAGASDFAHFNSQPKKLCDKLYQFYLDRGMVFATTSSDMSEEIDDETVSLSDWIVALPAERVYNNGLKVIIENPVQSTNLRVHGSDLDATAAYPHGEIVANISKKTTRKERLDIPGVEEYVIRMNTIGLSAGHTNALEFSNQILGMPTLDEMLNAFVKINNTPVLTHDMELRLGDQSSIYRF